MAEKRSSIDWPLVGRTQELTGIAHLRTDPRCPGVVLSGRAGVGKSRIAHEALSAAAADGALTEWVQATMSAATVPLAAVAALLSDPSSNELHELIRASAITLRTRAGDRPIVLAVDDAHLLDPASASLILHLASSAGVFVIATVRDGAQAPDAVVSLWKDAGAVRFDVTELDEPDLATLVETALGGPVEQALVRWASETSRANTLYLRELLLGAVTDGSLIERDGLWSLARRPRPSRSLSELIAERLAGLGDHERHVVELLSLAEPLTLAELIGLVGADAVAAAESRQVIEIATEPPNLARCGHPLYGEIARAGMPTVHALSARARLAEVIGARVPRTPDDSLRIARLLLDAGEAIPLDVLLDAARAANMFGDPELGANLARRAVEQGATVEGAIVLGRAHLVRKRFAEAEAVLASVKAPFSSPQQALEYVEQRTTVLYWGLKQPGAALALLDDARSWFDNRQWRYRLEPTRLHLLAVTDGFEHALAPAEEALSDPELQQATRRRLQPVHTANLFFSGRGCAAVELARSIRPTLPLRDQSDSLAFINCAMVDIEVGTNWLELEQWLTRVLPTAIRLDDQEAAGTAALALGCMCFYSARYRDASRWLAEAVLHLERQDPFGALLLARALRVGVAMATAEPARVAEQLKRCRAALRGDDPLPNQLPWLARAEAWGAAAYADHAGAVRRLLDAADETAALPLYGAALRYDALLLGAPPEPIAAAFERLRHVVDAPLTSASADHAAALAAHDGRALLRAVDAFEAIGATRYSVLCAADAARTFIAEGRQDSARQAAARCVALQPPNQDATPPAIEGLDAPAVGLTRREAQLVELAARGLSNAEIATQLVLSVRTVETHLYRAMQKLGVSDRRSLRHVTHASR